MFFKKGEIITFYFICYSSQTATFCTTKNVKIIQIFNNIIENNDSLQMNKIFLWLIQQQKKLSFFNAQFIFMVLSITVTVKSLHCWISTFFCLFLSISTSKFSLFIPLGKKMYRNKLYLKIWLKEKRTWTRNMVYQKNTKKMGTKTLV